MGALKPATLALAALGVFAIGRRQTPGQSDGMVLGLVLLAMISLVQAVFYVDARHRLAVEPLLMLFSGQGVAVLLPRRMARERGLPGSANA